MKFKPDWNRFFSSFTYAQMCNSISNSMFVKWLLPQFIAFCFSMFTVEYGGTKCKHRSFLLKQTNKQNIHTYNQCEMWIHLNATCLLPAYSRTVIVKYIVFCLINWWFMFCQFRQGAWILLHFIWRNSNVRHLLYMYT